VAFQTEHYKSMQSSSLQASLEPTKVIEVRLSDLQRAMALEAADAGDVQETVVKAVETIAVVNEIVDAQTPPAPAKSGFGRYIDPTGNCLGQDQTPPKGMTAFPLARYSSFNKAQRTGTSETRQLKNAKEICGRFEWHYDVNLAVLDFCTSAHLLTKKGIPRNFSPDAALGAFLEAAKKGKLPANAVLIVDDPSRFSRAVLSEATGKFWELVRNGVCIYITSMGVFINKKSLNDAIIQTRILFEFDRTFRESFNKVKTINDAKLINLEKAITTGQHVGLGWHATWVKFNKESRKNEEIKAKADVVRELIRRAVALEDLPTIQRGMRDNKVPNLSKKPGAKWRVSTIRRILQSEALIGVLNANIKVGVDENGKSIMQHVRIENFFPKVCSDEDWVKLQARFAIHRGKGGRRLGHRINNLFPGRVFCAECGCPMGPGSTTGRDWDVRAYTCINDQCTAKVSRFPVRVLEKDFFSMVLQQTPKQHLEDGADARACKRQMLMAQLTDAQEKHTAATAMALDQPKNTSLRVRAKELYDTVTKLEDDLKGMEAAVTLATHSDGGWESVVKDLGLPEALLTPNTAEQLVEFGRALDTQLADMKLRERLLEKFKSLVAGIDINLSSRKWKLRLMTGEVREERDCSAAVIAHHQNSFYKRFTPEVRRRMSEMAKARQARKLGVDSNTPTTVDIVRQALANGAKTRKELVAHATGKWQLGNRLEGAVWAALVRMVHRREVVTSFVPGQKKTKLYALTSKPAEEV